MRAGEESINDIRNRLNSPTRAKFDEQIANEHRTLTNIGLLHEQMQDLPIGIPDDVPRASNYRRRPKNKPNARLPSGADIAEKALRTHENAVKKAQKEVAQQARVEEQLQGQEREQQAVLRPQMPPTTSGLTSDLPYTPTKPRATGAPSEASPGVSLMAETPPRAVSGIKLPPQGPRQVVLGVGMPPERLLGVNQALEETPVGIDDTLEPEEDVSGGLPVSTAPPRIESTKRKRRSTAKAKETEEQIAQGKKGRKGHIQGKN
jgi:hypothetical protein